MNNKVIENICLGLSSLFSPLLVPSYACSIGLLITPLTAIEGRWLSVVTVVVCLISAILPLTAICILIRYGKVSDILVTKRSERALPYAISILSFLLAAYYLWWMMEPRWMCLYFCGVAAICILEVIINIWWKISAHASIMGSLCAMLFYITFHQMGIVRMLPWLSVVTILSGIICSARLYLGRNTQMQVHAGFALGFVVAYVFLSL